MWSRSQPLTKVGICAAVLACVLLGVRAATSVGESAQPVTFGEGSDRFPSMTAADWVQYAHYVVVATAVKESEDPASPQEIELGEGLVGRQVTFRVDNILYSSKQSEVPPLGDTFSMPALGWTFTDGIDNRSKFVTDNTSRLEQGHRYVIALVARQCTGSSAAAPALTWFTLGEASVIPYDESALGAGEFEGAEMTQEEVARQVSASAEASLREEVLGAQPEAVADRLAAAPKNESGADSTRRLERTCQG